MIITAVKAAELIKATEGRFFTVTFVKRSTGELRTMNARLGVKKYLKGGELPYNAAFNWLIPVFDQTKGEYRVIPIEGIKELMIDGLAYEVQS